jgi:hypothetical protein
MALLYSDSASEVKPIFFAHPTCSSTPRRSPGPSVALHPISAAHDQHAPAAVALRWAAICTFHHASDSRDVFMFSLHFLSISFVAHRARADQP